MGVYRKTLLFACLLLAGCQSCGGKPKCYFIVGGVGLVTAPVWAPVLAVKKTVDIVSDIGPAPRLSEPSAAIVEQRDARMMSDGEPMQWPLAKVFPVGPQAFFVAQLIKTYPWTWSITLVRSSAEAFALPITLPDNYQPLAFNGRDVILFAAPFGGAADRRGLPVKLDLVNLTSSSLPPLTIACGAASRSFSPSGRFVACSDKSGVTVYDVATGKMDSMLSTVTGATLSNITVDDSGQSFAVAMPDAIVKSSRPYGHEVKLASQPFALMPLVNPDGTRVLAAWLPDAADRGKSVIAVISLATGQILREVSSDGVPFTGGNESVFSEGGGRIAAISQHEVVVFALSESSDAKPVRIIVGRQHRIRGASFDSSGEWLLVLSDPPIAKLFHFVPPTSSADSERTQQESGE